MDDTLNAPALPKLPAPVKLGSMVCEDCDGHGVVGNAIYQGEFQPPEHEDCGSCGGSGRWQGDFYSADQMREYALAARISAPAAPAGWINVADRLPKCDHEQIFIGINTAGFAGAFNSLVERNGTTYCLYGTPEEEHAVMSDLEWWQPLSGRACLTEYSGREAAMSKLTCKNFHLRKMNGLWWFIAPYDPTAMEQARMSTGATPVEAYKKLIDLLASPGFVPPLSTPRSRALHERWQEAEARQKMGLHRPWSSLDCAVRNGGSWLS